MPREFDPARGIEYARQLAERTKTRAAALEALSDIGRSYAYRHGSCCAHTRIRHRDQPPMTCHGVCYPGEIQPDGKRVETSEPCRCPGWKESPAAASESAAAAAERTAFHGPAADL